jgi:hypothetical protein
MSAVSQYCDGFFRDELLRRNDLADPTPWVSVWDVSNVVSYETAFSSARAWSIWSYAYVAMAEVVIVSPLRASDS